MEEDFKLRGTIRNWGNGGMARFKGYSGFLPIFIVLSIVIVGWSALPWKIDSKSGEMGTTVDIRIALASHEVSAGDTIWYEYEASTLCWFIITTDPFEPEIGEKLNLSGTRNRGSFDCQTEGQYILQVNFQEIPSEGIATVEYESYVLDDSSRVAMTAKPLFSIVVTVALAFMVINTRRRARATYSDEKTVTHESYWQYFTSKTGNWIAVVAGAVIITAGTIIDFANPTSTLMEFALSLTFFIGRNVVIFGLILGLTMPWGEYKARAHQGTRSEEV